MKNIDLTPKTHGPLMRALMFLFLPFLSYWLAVASITTTFPMIWAISAGRSVEIEFVVADPDLRNRKYCRQSIKLEGLPLALDTLCGVDEKFASELLEGSRIIFVGEGTDLGVFVNGAKLIEVNSQQLEY